MTALLPPFPARGYRRPWAPPAAAVLLAAAVSSYVTVLRCDNMPLAPCRRCDGQLHPDHGRCIHCGHGHGRERRRGPRVDERDEAARDLGHILPRGMVNPGVVPRGTRAA